MKIGFMVNDIATEQAGYTTGRMAMAAINRGHEAWMLSAGDFAYDPDEKIRARAVHAPKAKYTSGAAYLADIRGKKARFNRVTVDDLDVLVLRSNPADEVGTKFEYEQAETSFCRSTMTFRIQYQSRADDAELIT